jgi:PAS domain S-box-containing protein
MVQRASWSAKATSYLLPIATAAFAIAIFITDTITHLEIAVAVLYAAVVLMASRFCQARGVLLVAAGCVSLTVLSAYLSVPAGPEATGLVNTFISFSAIGLTTFLVLQSKSAEAAMREQASLLDLTHDSVFTRGMDGTITYWNRGAEELYGWTRAEALGKLSHQLLEKSFPAPRDQINAELLRTGRWDGELVCKKRDGTPVVVAGRWSLQRDAQGRPAAVLETHTEITERRQAREDLRQAQANLERRNRVMLLGEMTASIAHEVNQPISAIVANAIEAMGEAADIPRKLAVSSSVSDSNDVLVEVRDTGPELDPAISTTCSKPSTRPSRMAWAWGWRSAARSSRRMAGGCRRRPTSPAAPSFALRCRSRGNRRRGAEPPRRWLILRVADFPNVQTIQTTAVG